MSLKNPIARREYQREWERKKFAVAPRIRVLTAEQKARKRERERIRRANGTAPRTWDKSSAAKIHRREYAKRWRAENPEKMRAQNRLCYERNLERQPDCYRNYGKAWKAKNPDKVKESSLKSYIKHRVSRLFRFALWRKKNPAKILAFSQAARARKRDATIEDCSKKIAILKKERFCHWCCDPITPKTVHVDHVIPLARGGKHCNDNLVASCHKCNTSRKAKLISEWTWKEAA